MRFMNLALTILETAAIASFLATSASGNVDWFGNVSPCPEQPNGYLTVFDNVALDVYVDLFSWGTCPEPWCLGGTRSPGRLGGYQVGLALVPVATNLGGFSIPMQYVGDIQEWIPTTRYVDVVDRYKATLSPAVLRGLDEVYYRPYVVDWSGTYSADNACGGDGRLMKLRVRHDGMVGVDTAYWGAVKLLYAR